MLDCSVQSCLAVAGGGISLASGGTGEVRRTTFIANSADADGDGGAIENWGTLIVADCTLSGNQAPGGSGSAIDNAGTLTITNCTVVNGTASGDPGGGAILNRGNCEMVDSRVTGNFSYLGGGIYNEGSWLIRRSTIDGNAVRYSGQGMANYGGQLAIVDSAILNNGCSFCNSGGGIFVYSGTVALTNCTISGNASFTGAGIEIFQGNVVLDSCTVAENGAYAEGRGLLNRGGTTTLRNTIVAGNEHIVSFNWTTLYGDLNGNFISAGHNLIGFVDSDTGISNGVNGDRVGSVAEPMDVKLGPLQDNGGPTWTHALLAGSPAIDAGSSGTSVMDQRGHLRAFDFAAIPNAADGDGSDIGAFELENRIVAIQRIDADLHLTFISTSNQTYRIEYSPLLPTTNWMTLCTVPGVNGLTSVIDTGAASQPARFYRVGQE